MPDNDDIFNTLSDEELSTFAECIFITLDLDLDNTEEDKDND